MTKRFIIILFLSCMLMVILQSEIYDNVYCNPTIDQFQISNNQGLSSTISNNLIEVVKTEPHYIILRFQLPKLKVQSLQQDDDIYTHIEFDRAHWTTEFGRPKLPKWTAQIGLPSVSSVTATVLQKKNSFRKLQNPLLTNQIIDPFFPDAHKRDDVSSESTQPIRSKLSVMYPAELIEVIPVGFVRSQRIGALHIHPIQYNSTTNQIKITEEITFRIDFFGASTETHTPLAALPQDSPIYEGMFRTMLLNNTQSLPWRQGLGQMRTHAIQGAPAAPTETRRRFKIAIKQNDMYFISYNNLVTAGVTPETIDLDSIKVETGGRQQGFYVFDENQNETLDRGEKVVFYARGLQSNKFTDTNVYWFSFDEKGADVSQETDNIYRTSIRSAAPNSEGIAAPTAFKTRIRYEKNNFYDPLDGDDVQGVLDDHFFWTGLRGDNSDISRKHFAVLLPQALPRYELEEDATLRVKLQGASRRNAALHKAVLYFNDRQLGNIEEWRRQKDPIITRFIPQNRISHDQENILRLDALDRNGTPEGSYDFYLDWYEFDYWRNFRADSNRLEFNSITLPAVSGKSRFNVVNFNNDTIDVYSLNQSTGITGKLVDGEVSRYSSGYQIVFEDEIFGLTNYFVVGSNNYQSITALTEVPPSNLRNPTTQADYIVISHKSFIESITPLVEYRRSQGLTVKVVDIDDIYDEFGAGLFDPLAIQHFLRYVYDTWLPPAPTYVLLVGDAHYDYKEVIVRRYAEDPNIRRAYNLYPNFVPTYHGWAPESGETAMDQRFVNISGVDRLPDMLIGRLSVQKASELKLMVQKIIDYETKPRIGPWQATLVQVADNEVNNPGDISFELSRNDLINDFIPPAYNTKQIYLRKYENSQRTKSEILKAFAEGALVIEYAGHGGIHTWADEGIFHIDNVSSLRNSHLPLVITTTCLNGEFDKPQEYGNHCLSEAFLLSRYGAVSSLSATRLTYAQANSEFDEDLFTAMFTRIPFNSKQGPIEVSNVPLSIGKIVTDAKIRFISRIINRRWIPGAEQYTLFGDPATQLALPALDIRVNLEEFALNSTKEIVVFNNEVGSYDSDGVWWKAEEFSTEKLVASAIFQNNFDDDLSNDFTLNRDGRVWQGEFSTIRLDVPSRAIPGKGAIRLFADDGKRAAVGGAFLWVDTPIIGDVREVIDAVKDHTINIQVLIFDDMGGTQGIRSIDVIWDVNYANDSTPMVKIPPPPSTGELPPGGQWYEIQTPISLPLPGYRVRYRIVVTDTTGLQVAYPSLFKRVDVNVPEGTNLSVGTDGASIAPIRYTFDKNTETYFLTAEIVNIGGRTAKYPIDVIFAEGNPDLDGNLVIDEEAEEIGRVTIEPEDWQDGDTVLQHTIANLRLKENLSTGVHNIYVLIDPEEDLDEVMKGNIAESKEYDNTLNITFVVNEFFYEPSKPLSAFSLDRVFDIDIPAEAATVEGERVPLTVSSSAPFNLTQASLKYATIPHVAAIRRGLIRTGEELSQQYEVSFRTPDVTLKKPAKIKLRFDVSSLADFVRENTEWKEGTEYFRDAMIDEAEKLSLYAWHLKYEKWRRLPSQVSYVTEDERPDPKEGPIFQLENYVTPIETENANKQLIPLEGIRINPNQTPAGLWVILFLDSKEYEVYFKRNEFVGFARFDNPGQLDNTYRIENYGIEFTIPSSWTPPPELNDGSPVVPFEFADILIFETGYEQSATVLKNVRNQNIGNGTATITARAGPKGEFAVGDWFIFFTSFNRYELRDRTGGAVYLSNDIPVVGEINEKLYASELGFEILVSPSSEPFVFGDKIKFSTAQVATITAETNELTPFTLISSDDTEAPSFNLWVDGVQPQTGSIIKPRPHFSILLEDADGINLDTLVFRRGDNGNPLEPITDFVLRNPENLDTVPIDYNPVLFPGEYAFEIEASDFNGHAIGGKAGKYQTRFVVIEVPDVDPPAIEILVNDEFLPVEEVASGNDGNRANSENRRFTEQPSCEIRVTDDFAIDNNLLNITFSMISADGMTIDPTRRYREFDAAAWEFDEENPLTAEFRFAPDLQNGTYRIYVAATDSSGNTTEVNTDFTLDEAVTLSDVFNVPNPIVKGKTFFTYQLAQPSDKVTIKIYTVSGRLIKTIADASAKRGNNETFWDGKDEVGIRCANGIYLYRVIAQTQEKTVQKIGKLAILR